MGLLYASSEDDNPPLASKGIWNLSSVLERVGLKPPRLIFTLHGSTQQPGPHHGGSGHLGFRTLRTALEHGYPVRAVVRSESKAQLVKETADSLVLPGHLEFVIIPDFTAPNAFDAAVKNVKHIIHIASPLATAGSDDDDFHDLFVKPAVQGTLNVFSAARRAGTVERIVLTSSVAAIHPMSAWFAPTDTIYTPDNRLDEIPPPYLHRVSAYWASKIAALKVAETFIEDQKPDFDAIYIMPSFILGRDDLCKTTSRFFSGTNFLVLSQALGIEVPQAPTRANNFNSVEDCANVHVWSLNREKVAGNQSFLVSNSGMDGMQWTDANEIVKRRFPEAVEEGIFKADGPSQTVVCRLDVEKTERVFGFKHASFEDCVVGVCGHYLELLEQERGE